MRNRRRTRCGTRWLGPGGSSGGGVERLGSGYLPEIEHIQPPNGLDVAWERKESAKDDFQV